MPAYTKLLEEALARLPKGSAEAQAAVANQLTADAMKAELLKKSLQYNQPTNAGNATLERIKSIVPPQKMADGGVPSQEFPIRPDLDEMRLAIARNRAGQPVQNASDMIPGAIRGLGNTIVGAGRGAITSGAGWMTDLINSVDIPQIMTGQSYQIPYGTEYLKENLPLAPTSQEGKVAQQLGEFAPLPIAEGVQAVKAGVKKMSPEIAAALHRAYMTGEGPLGKLVTAGGTEPMFAIPPKSKSIAKAEAKSEAAAESALTAEEQNLVDLFNKKAEREAKLAKKVEKQAAAEPKEKGESKGRKGAISPDYFRAMLAAEGEDAVLKAAQAGEHIKRDAYGNYVGFPRHVTSPQALGAMRKSLDEQFADSVNAIAMADPERLGTWYDRAKEGIAMSAEPHQLNRILEHHGVYSAGVSPESELGFALKHLNSRAVGVPEMAYRGAPMRTLDKAIAEDRAAKLGFKIGEYKEKNDPRLPNAGPFGVNDFRAAQGFGYTDPAGDIWKGGVSGTMHPVMDAETALLVDRANQANVGGRSTWAGPHIQEMPWVLGKAQDLYSRGKEARFAGSPLEGVKAAIREANNTAQDYMYKHAASSTHEAIPGASTGHVPSMLAATPEEKAAYTATGRWDQPTPYTSAEAPTVGAGNRDVLYSALGMRQLPAVESTGAYLNSAGQMEHNPMTISRPLFDFPTGGGGGKASPQTVKTASALEKLRAVIDAQEAGALNLPNTKGSVSGKNALVLDTRGSHPTDPTLGVMPTKEQLAAITRELEGTGYGATATSRGITIFPYDSDAMGGKDLAKLMKSKGKELQKIYPSKPMKSVNTSIYTPGIGKFGEKEIEPTAPYSGEATSAVLQEFAGLPHSVAQNISESEGVRNVIRAKMERDAAMQGAREDIQNTRKFFAKEDWPKVVELVRKGATPAAALATLGYSLNSLAEERR